MTMAKPKITNMPTANFVFIVAIMLLPELKPGSYMSQVWNIWLCRRICENGVLEYWINLFLTGPLSSVLTSDL
jgi:hypothetical protein